MTAEEIQKAHAKAKGRCYCGDCITLRDITIRDRVLAVEISYPRSGERLTTVEIGLTDVRAADSVRVTYDFERDGWVIQQAATFSWENDDPVKDEDWQEVAFVQAWGRLR